MDECANSTFDIAKIGIDSKLVMQQLAFVAQNEPEMVANLPSLFAREGARYDLASLMHYLFIVTSTATEGAEYPVVSIRLRNAEERAAAIGTLKCEHLAANVS